MRKAKSIFAAVVTLSLSFALSGCESESVPEKYCSKYMQCYPEDFQDEFDSIGECSTYISAQMSYARETYGAACYSAMNSALSCISSMGCNDDPDVVCASEGAAVDQACEVDVTDPCPGYVAGTDDDECCQDHNPCDWAGDNFCDCGGTCGWDTVDCAAM